MLLMAMAEGETTVVVRNHLVFRGVEMGRGVRFWTLAEEAKRGGTLLNYFTKSKTSGLVLTAEGEREAVLALGHCHSQHQNKTKTPKKEYMLDYWKKFWFVSHFVCRYSGGIVSLSQASHGIITLISSFPHFQGIIISSPAKSTVNQHVSAHNIVPNSLLPFNVSTLSHYHRA